MGTKLAMRPASEVILEAEAFARTHGDNPAAQMEWARQCPVEERDIFLTAMDAVPRVKLEGIEEFTMELSDELPAISRELRDMIRRARPVWNAEAR